MNNMFVYRGILVAFDKSIGYFFYKDRVKVSNKDKQKLLNYISGQK